MLCESEDEAPNLIDDGNRSHFAADDGGQHLERELDPALGQELQGHVMRERGRGRQS